jgi:hypothetical protein
MTAVVTCRTCGATFEPTSEALRAGTWRTCPNCRPPNAEETRCRECGRVLRAGTRTICAACLGISL